MPRFSDKTTRTASKYAFWRGHIQAQRKSGLTIKEYCQRHGLSRHTFGYWKKRVEVSEEESVQIPVVPIGRLHCGYDFGLRVRTSAGHEIEVKGEFSCSDVAMLIKELG